MATEEFDLAIIGAGAGGLQAAEFAVKLGAKVALVEKGNIGGDCTWTGCVPSKALLHVAKLTNMSSKAADYGILKHESSVDMKRVRDHVQSATADVYRRDLEVLQSLDGLDLITGWARFQDPFTLKVGERRIIASKFIIATGARPAIPAIPGLSEIPFFTYEHIFANDKLPDHLLVLGAGPIGVELAQAYRRLGARVTLVDVDLLPDEEPEVRRTMEQVFSEEGIKIGRGLVTAVRQDNNLITLTVGDDDVARGDMLLVATGRRANLNGLNLEAAGVEHTEEGIQVDDQLRTSAKHIFAAGDCLGGPQFSHYAAWQGFKAARNALLPGSSSGKSVIVPRTTFTDPEIAQVGVSESAARRDHGDDVRVSLWTMDRVDRAITDDARDGFIKIVHKKDGSLLGATIVANSAGEMITEFVLGLQHNLKMADLAGAMHVYPTYSIGVQMLAADVATDDFLSSVTGRVLRRLNRYSVQ